MATKLGMPWQFNSSKRVSVWQKETHQHLLPWLLCGGSRACLHHQIDAQGTVLAPCDGLDFLQDDVTLSAPVLARRGMRQRDLRLKTCMPLPCLNSPDLRFVLTYIGHFQLAYADSFMPAWHAAAVFQMPLRDFTTCGLNFSAAESSMMWCNGVPCLPSLKH